jgi:hypothetical protein
MRGQGRGRAILSCVTLIGVTGLSACSSSSTEAETTTSTITGAPTSSTASSATRVATDPQQLVFASDATTKGVIKAESRFGGSTTQPFAVRSAGNAPLVVSQRLQSSTKDSCAIVAAAPTSAGYQGGCLPTSEAATRLLYVSDSGPNSTDKTKWYIAWLAIPSTTSYVTFTYGSTRVSVLPLNGVVYATHVGAGPIPGAAPPAAIAYDSLGNELGRADAKL